MRQVSEGANHRPTDVPVLRYDNRSEILDYLGFRHITGVKEWDPIAKARHLSTLLKTLQIKDPDEQFRSLARSIGSRADYVAKLLASLAVHEVIEREGYYGIGEDEAGDPIEFSLLTTAISYSKIAAFVGVETSSPKPIEKLKETELHELTQWVFAKDEKGVRRVPESRDLGELAEVVTSDRSLAAFRGGMSLDAAAKLSGVPEIAFREALDESRAKLQQAEDQMIFVKRYQRADSQVLFDVMEAASGMRQRVEDKLIQGRTGDV